MHTTTRCVQKAERLLHLVAKPPCATSVGHLENFWQRDEPIYPTGRIELQNHGNTLWFKNIYIREIPREK